MDYNHMFKEIHGISVVIPALNEEKAIVQTVCDCKTELEQWGKVPFEIIVINDGSKDRTAELALHAGAKVINHPANGGYGRSLKDGINAALYDTIVMTDADGTYPITDLPKLLDKYSEGFDMVVGSRTGAHYKQSLFKSLLRSILKFLVEWASGRTIDDINSGYRVFSKQTSKLFFRHLCDTFSFTTSITLAYMMNSLFVAYVPTDYYHRIGSSHVRLFNDSLRTISYIVKQILYFDPLKIFILFGGVWFLFACCGFLVSALFGLQVGYYLGVFGLFGIFLMFGLGLLAEQIRQLIVSVGRRDD